MTEEVKGTAAAEPEQKIVNINGVEYLYDTLSDQVKALIAVYESWQGDLAKANSEFKTAKLSIAKNEAALRDLIREITTVVETPAVVEGQLETPADAPAV